MSTTIERIPAASLAGRIPELIRLGRPAVIPDLFRGEWVDRLSDIGRAREMLGSTEFSTRLNYIDANLERVRCFVRGTSPPRAAKGSRTTFAEYLDLIAREPETRHLISEEATPECILRHVDLRAIGIETVIGGYRAEPAAPPPDTAYSEMFAAGAGNCSDLHTDWDGRDVILFQGFGRKRVCLFPVQSAPYLLPVDIYSTVSLAGMSDAERQAFLVWAGGMEHTMLPGEAIFMPAFIWHHFEYLEPAVSITFRFGGVVDQDAQALIHTMHHDRHMQSILAGTRDPERAAACRAAMSRLRAARDRRYAGAAARYRALRELAAECNRATLPPGARSPRRGIVEAEDFLDGQLCAAYDRLDEGSAARRWAWQARESARKRLRRWGRRLAYRA